VRRGALPQRDQLDLARRGLEPPEVAAALRGVPHDAVRTDGDIVRATARGQGEGPGGHLGGHGAGQEQHGEEGERGGHGQSSL
jgi:hypothetical protein